MRYTLPLFANLLLVLLIGSCAKSNECDKNVEPTGDDYLICQIDAAQSSLENCQSKTSLSQDFIPVWTSGDEISVFGENGKKSKFKLTEGQGTAQGTFRGDLPLSNNYCAIYPHADENSYSAGVLTFSKPKEQNGVVDDFPNNGNTMVALFTNESPTPVFKNLFGLLMINLSGTAKVGKITIISNKNDEMLWGDFSLTVNSAIGSDSQTLSVAGGSNETSLVFSSPVQLLEQQSHSFYFVLPAGSLSTGFILDVYDQDDNLVFTHQTDKNQIISRSKIHSMANLENVNCITGSDAVPEPFSWVAYNNMGRSGTDYQTVIDPQKSGYPQLKQNKYVGIFYFIWHTSNASSGPYDIQKKLGAGNYNFCDDEKYGYGQGKIDHWGEPYLGYYRDDDLWVLRKHAQMLSDAGVDFIAFDVTNNVFYKSEITKLCNLFVQMRAEGCKTPQITFMVWHSGADGKTASVYSDFNHDWAVTYLYNSFYAIAAYDDLWFRWDGKPLMMAIGSHVTNSTIRNYFTFRPTWYLWNNNAQTKSDVGDPWYYAGGSTNDKWPWGVAYTDDTDNPMRVGTHNGVNEFCSVAPATHPVSNIGRSYPINQGITYKSGLNSYTKQPGKGIYFRSQFNAANKLDPQIIFFTGWNEFLMGQYEPGVLEFYYCGGVNAQKLMFVDQYNNEFSRDIEPIAGDFGDAYYYYMADFIRQFKGVSALPSDSQWHSITIDGRFVDWYHVGSCYADDKNDTKWRGYDSNGGNSGWAAYGNTLGNYINKTGRNDLQLCKVSTDGTNIAFYIQAGEDLTGYNESGTGLKLLITSGSNPTWEGFNYLVEPTSSSKATLKSAGSGVYSWSTISSEIPIAVNGNKLELCIPLSLIGITNANSFSLDFKWVDNVDLSQTDGIQRCMRDGDSAPNGRFRYRYIFNK